MNPSNVRVLVIHSQPIAREGIIHVLEASLDNLIVDGTGSFPDAMKQIRHGMVDLVVSEFRNADETVLKFLPDISAIDSPPRCLIVSELSDLHAGYSCAKAGASGFVSASAPVDELIGAVRALLSGKTHFSERLLRALIAPTDRKRRHDGMLLTPRELEVFALLGGGHGVSRIAGSLGISVKTVEAHRENIKNKLGHQTAAQVQAAATRWIDGKSSVSSSDGGLELV